jgi:hypothetical protein
MISAKTSAEKTKTPYISMWIEGNIMYCMYAADLHVSLEIAKSCVERRIFFSNGKSYPLMIDMKGIKSTTWASRQYLATMGSTLVKAGALITGSQFNRVLGNLFLTIDRPRVPTKLFTNEGKAREWLQAYV